MPRRSPFFVVLVAGLVAGTLDISDAILFYGLRSHVPARRVLQSVAAGLLGRAAALGGGWRTALLGLVLHFLIALTWAAVFVFLARRFAVLRRRAVVSGLIYGGFVYVFMNYVVLPLSRYPKAAAAPPAVALVNAVLAIVLLIGLPIALITRRLDPPLPV